MTYSEYFRSLRRGWRLIVGGLILGGVAALGVILMQPPRYEASSQLFVSARQEGGLSSAVEGGQFSQERVTSYAHLLTGNDLASAVISRLRLDMTTDDLVERIEASAIPETVLLDVTVTNPRADRAFAIAEAVNTEFATMVDELESPNGITVQVAVVSRPELPTTPASPRVPRNLAMGLTLGLLAGAAGAVARGRLDTAVKDAAAVTKAPGAPVMDTMVHDRPITGIEDQGGSPAGSGQRSP
jgi:capsular polysaccharide biosynthesis protein